MHAPTDPERRQWLRKGLLYTLVGATMTGFAGILADVWLGAGHFSSARWTAAAPLATLAGDGVYPFAGQKAAIIRRGDRLAALSLECTHLGCLVNVVDQGFYCPCHGSEFGPRGEVYSGPATTPLPWHTLRIEAGQVWIHTGERLTRPAWISL